MKNAKLTKIKEGLMVFLKKLFKNLFLIMILFVLLDILLGVILLNKYYIQIEKKEAQPSPSLKINEETLNQFSSEWQRREKVFQEAAAKQYANPFRSRTIE